MESKESTFMGIEHTYCENQENRNTMRMQLRKWITLLLALLLATTAAAGGSGEDEEQIADAGSADRSSDSGIELEIIGDDPDLPLVAILATGGTIAAEGDPGALTGYSAGEVEGVELVAGVPSILDHANVAVIQVANVGSSSIGQTELFDLANYANELFAQDDPEVAGIVVTHGTFTLEETVWFLNLTVHSDKPVVGVGAQRPPTAISPDGPLNLLNAVRVAADEGARGMGAFIVMNDEINAARDVTKTNAYRVSAFRSGELGYLGYADADRIVFNRAPINKRHTYDSEFDVSGVEELPKVGVIFSHQEASFASLQGLIDAGYDGVVIHGHGTGGFAPDMRAGIREMENDIVMVRTAQTVNSRIQDSSGYRDDGVVSAEDLGPLKARILLQLALTQTDDFDELVRIFQEY